MLRSPATQAVLPLRSPATQAVLPLRSPATQAVRISTGVRPHVP